MFIFIFNKKRISWLSMPLVLSLFTLGCVNLQDINWENTPITGTVLGTVEQPSQSGPSTIKIAIKLDSGEMVLVRPIPKNSSIVKGQKLKLYRGTTNLGSKFYSLAPPSQYK